MTRATFRSLLSLAALVSGCASAPPPRLPDQPEWARDLPVHVDASKTTIESNAVGEATAELLRTQVVADLRALGFFTLDAPRPEAFSVVLDAFDRSTMDARVVLDSHVVASFRVDGVALGCGGTWWGIYPEEYLRCYARGLALRLVDSRSVIDAVASSGSARAARAPTPATPATPAPAPARRAGVRVSRGLVAVLPLDTRDAKIEAPAARGLEEAIRTVVGDVLSPRGYTVLTGDTTLAVLADNGVDAAKACDATCALDAARQLKADLFISGTVATSEGEYLAFVRIYEIASGRQLASVQLEGATAKELRRQFEAKAAAALTTALSLESM